jgi:hypothetical protein
MSRSGYIDDVSNSWENICWRGAVKSAINGARGQKLLREMLAALDAMPEKVLIKNALIEDGRMCALGTVGVARGTPLDKIDPENPEQVAKTFDIAPALAREIAWVNDEGPNGWWDERETPAARWHRVREWVAAQIIE